ncbi:flagellar basal body rod protein FlgC [Adhaeretor mobilis]|uniref:Uncharacterized protein n=1 Tax=Adhaeretor mobilis TaxID=1930276 RepID=A0A517N0Q0_9BACT|nr:hypothetical protein [Adhaeretor mobilis]QDT00598.1 hypothetical protein HG15A2_39370 [Adhaeretor mobilis]
MMKFQILFPSLLASLIFLVAPSAFAANQTATTTPVIVGGDLPYRVSLQRYDMATAEVPSLHSFAAAEHDGQWVVIAGLTNGLHGFDLNQSTLPDSKQNRDVWVIDPVAKTSWHRTLDPSDLGSGLTEAQVLSLTTANSQFEQIGSRLYMTGGYGDTDPLDDTQRGTFNNLTAFDLPGLVDWAKGGTGTASQHIRQIDDPTGETFKITGGDMYEVDGQMQLVFGQDYEGRYRGSLNGEYSNQVRTFTIQDDGTTLGFTTVQNSTPEDRFRRRDLNVYPTLTKNGDGSLSEALTVLAGVFTETNGAWTVPVEVDGAGNPVQADGGLDPLNAGGVLDNSTAVFKQGMNIYHSAKLGLFSEGSGDMHQLLFGGITMQEYDPTNPAADANGFVTDQQLPNTNQISSVVRDENGKYEQHFLGEYPELFADDNSRLRFGSNAEFFLANGIDTFDNGVIDLDALTGTTQVGYIYGGLIANAPHVFGNPTGLSSASGEVFAVLITRVPEPTSLILALVVMCSLSAGRCRA